MANAQTAATVTGVTGGPGRAAAEAFTRPPAKPAGDGVAGPAASARPERAEGARTRPAGRTGCGAAAVRWREHLAAWAQSGLSQAEFCRRRGLALPSFYYWRARLRGERRLEMRWVEARETGHGQRDAAEMSVFPAAARRRVSAACEPSAPSATPADSKATLAERGAGAGKEKRAGAIERLEVRLRNGRVLRFGVGLRSEVVQGWAAALEQDGGAC